MIPSPNLDDRTYKEIVDEAIKLIPHYCPEWTNHNPTDPGITLIELFAWMTEMIIYRLNKVPNKVYLTLLDLVGLSQIPPQSSRAVLTFHPVEQYEEDILVKKGTQIATTSSDSDESIVFETEKDLVVKNINLLASVSIRDGLVTENFDPNSNSLRKNFSLFSGVDEIERYIYLSDPSLMYLAEDNVINISFNNTNKIKAMADEIVNFLEWKFWDGKKWTEVDSKRSILGRKREINDLYISGPVDIDAVTVNGIEGYFLRASLVDIPERGKCFEINDVVVRLLFRGEGLNPDVCLNNTDNMLFYEVDTSKDFEPYSGIPKYNDSFYIASDEVFSKDDSEITIDISLSDSDTVKKPGPRDNLIFKYEYWNGRNWLEIGSSKTEEQRKPVGEYNFIDKTQALTKSGIVKFNRPKNMKEVEVDGQLHYWIRIRIGAGDFGTGGKYVVDDHGKWDWSFEQSIKPPVLSRIKLQYLANSKPFKNVISYYDFSYFDFSKIVSENYIKSFDEEAKIQFFNILKVNKEKSPITYFGFNQKFSSGDNSIYFRVDERKKIMGSKSSHNGSMGIGKIKSRRSASLKWEYWNGTKWHVLDINDYTDSFHQSGFIQFQCPNDFKDKKEFGEELFWIRVILEGGSFEIEPKIVAINLNSVYARNEQTHRDESIGSSFGAPSQEFELLHGPVLSDMQIYVKENSLPPADERELIISEEGEDAIKTEKTVDGQEEILIRYHRVENFYGSSSKSRHYVLDFIGNKIIFGDGVYGIIPPQIKSNIIAYRYKTGGGSHGNVGSNTINLLKENIPFISSVNNFYSAEGGSDLEDIDGLKRRANNVFKNLNRAVTAEDYEWLAMEASASVARAKCLSKAGKGGEVIVVIVPKPDLSDFDFKKELYPTTELQRRVKDFLNIRKLVGTKLKVEGPVYLNITLEMIIIFKKGIQESQILKNQIELSIRRFLHPITGGPKGEGWPFGTPVTKNDIFQLLEKMEGIYYIEKIDMINNDLKISLEKLILNEDNQIFINEIVIKERKNQF